MKKFYAIAKLDNSLIVSADSESLLQEKIREIRTTYPDFYNKYVVSGFYIVNADDVRQAKGNKSQITYDLPLFAAPEMGYFIYDIQEDDPDPICKKSNLRAALAYCQEQDQRILKIVVKNANNEVIKILDDAAIRSAIEEQTLADKRNRKQLNLF